MTMDTNEKTPATQVHRELSAPAVDQSGEIDLQTRELLARGRQFDHLTTSETYLESENSGGISSPKKQMSRLANPKANDSTQGMQWDVRLRFVVVKSRYPRLREREWEVRTLVGQSAVGVFEDIEKIVRRSFHRLEFRLNTSQKEYEVAIERGDEERFAQMKRTFDSEIRTDMKITKHWEYVVTLEPDGEEVEIPMGP